MFRRLPIKFTAWRRERGHMAGQRQFRTAAVLTLVAGVLGVSPVDAADDVRLKSARINADLMTAFNTSSGDQDLVRATIRPDIQIAIRKRWRFDVNGRIELADDNTGLGTVDTFSDASRPLIDEARVRIELDRVILQYKRRGTRIKIGKQVTAWGVLDGLQVTDRFDASRRRDFVLTDPRPDRIARWGVRAQQSFGSWQIDMSASLDPTVDQIATAGDVFFPRAPRLRGGFGFAVPNFPAFVTSREEYLSDVTIGGRLSRDVGAATISVLSISGPDTEPVLSSALTATLQPAISLNYLRRTLVGGSVEVASGAQIWRLEAAHILDQPINTVTATPLSRTTRPRWLAGVGADWDAPMGFLVNGQVAVDHIDAGGLTLARPKTDVIGTVRFQRYFSNNVWLFKNEWIGSLTDGDGVVRPSLTYQADDNVTLSLGADIIFGQQTGLFGQFRDDTRVWARIAVSI